MPNNSNAPNWAELSLDALAIHVAILDPQGVILKVNRAWRAFAEANAGDPSHLNEGANYLAACDRAQGPDAEGAATFGAGIRAVSQGRAPETRFEYPCHSPEEQRWFQARITRFPGEDGQQYLLVTHTNITDRWQTEIRLREHEHQLRLFVQYSPAAIAMLDTGMNYLMVSQRWLDSYRLPAEQLIGRNHYQVFPDLPERWRAIHQACLAGAVEKCEEDPFPRADGTLDWVRWEIRPWRREDGAIGGIIIFSEVITERKLAEDAQLRQQAMLARTEEGVQLGSWAWDVDTDTVTWSAELFRIMQLDPALGAPPFAQQHRIFPPEDMARLRQAATRAIQEGIPYELELNIIRPDGTGRICTAHGNPLLGADGKVHFLHGWFQDITERKRMEAALQASEVQFQTLFESDIIGVTILEPILDAQGRPSDFRILQVNQAAASRSGRDAAEMMARTARGWCPDLHPDYLEPYLRAAATGEPDKFERFIPATQLYLEIHIKTLKSGLLAVLNQDITERKRAELAHASLQDALRTLAATLRKAQEDERLRVSREIHDDLGQLLTALKIDLGWLERKLTEPGLPPACNGLVDRVVQAAELADVVQATVQRIAMELRPSLVDQLGLEGALRHELRRLQERTALRFSLPREGTFPVLPAQVKDHLFYICREALTNVLRHAQATNVEVGWRQEGAAAVFTVKDDGIGLGGVDLAVTPAIGMTGMRERAELCGGTLTFEANPPHGTMVTVRVPTAGRAAEGSTER